MTQPLDPAGTARAALGGIKEAIKVGREIHKTAKEVNQFLDAEARSRIAWKKKQQQQERRGDMVWVDAVEEYRIIRQIRDAEAAMYLEVEREFGRAAVSELKSLIVKMRKQHQELNDVFYQKRMQVRREMFWLLLASSVIYATLKITGIW